MSGQPSGSFLGAEQRRQLFRTTRSFLGRQAGGRPASTEWQSYLRELREQGLPDPWSHSALAYLAEQRGSSLTFAGGTVTPGATPSPALVERLRLLHPMEEELVTPEAYGALLDALRLGLLDRSQTEEIFEAAINQGPIPVDAATMEFHLAQSWARGLLQGGIQLPS